MSGNKRRLKIEKRAARKRRRHERYVDEWAELRREIHGEHMFALKIGFGAGLFLVGMFAFIVWITGG
jgi:hypothetical protein